MTPVTTAADDSLEYNYFHCCSEKMRLDISCESSARKRIHINIKPYFLRKVKVKKMKVLSAAILLGSLRVNMFVNLILGVGPEY